MVPTICSICIYRTTIRKGDLMKRIIGAIVGLALVGYMVFATYFDKDTENNMDFQDIRGTLNEYLGLGED